MEFTFLANPLNRAIFTYAPPRSKRPQIPVIYPIGRRELFIPQESILSKICWPQQQKGVEKNYGLICQNLVRKYENDLKHVFFIFCMIYNFFKCDGFTVL